MKNNITAQAKAPPLQKDVVATGRAMKSAMIGGKRRRHDPGHSRFVSTLKLSLSLLALILIVLVAAWPYLRTQQNRFRLGFTEIRIGESGGPAMLNPRYVGADSSAQPYTITADLAKNLLKKNSSVELEMPKASITLKDDTWLVLTSETGIFARDKKTLDLLGSVNLFHDSGYEFRTEKARVDLAAGIATSDDPVQGQGQFGHLEAEGFRLHNKSKVIHFLGKSKLIIYPGIGAPEFEGG